MRDDAPSPTGPDEDELSNWRPARHPTSAAIHTANTSHRVAVAWICRMSNSFELISANDGQAAITRAVAVGSATLTFAAKLAMLPTTSSVHAAHRPGHRRGSWPAVWWTRPRTFRPPPAASALLSNLATHAALR